MNCKDHSAPSPIKRLLVIAVLVCTFFIGVTILLRAEIESHNASLAKAVENRANGLREYFIVGKHMLYTMQRNMQQNLRLAEAGRLRMPQISRLRDYPEFQDYGIESERFDSHGEASEHYLSGSLSGIGSIKAIDETHRKEIHAVLALDATLGSVIQSLPDLKWVYYTSANRFIFIAPAVKLSEFHLSDKTLQKAFWQQAIPENNPELNLVVTDVYDDDAGKGMMISLSLPVVFEGQFRGVLSLDIGLDSLVQRLSSRTIPGQSALLDEKHQVIIKQASMPTTVVEHQPGDMVFVQPILDKQVVLLHKLPRMAIYYTALKQSFARIAVLNFALVLIYMLFQKFELLRKIEHLADTDPLTKLMNRRAMARIAQSMINYAHRYQRPLCFLLLDIDHFKKINDTHGHNVGDRVLEQLAVVLQTSVRKSDEVSRHGGEEFLLVLPDSTTKDGHQMAERIRNAVADTLFSGKKLPVSISLGCAEWRLDETYSDVLKRADDALYQAKHLGRNRTVIAESNP